MLFRSDGMSISRLHRFAAATARQVACSPGGSDQAFAQPTGAFTPELSTIRSPSSLSGITTGVSEQFPRRYFQPLERHLASLHSHPAHRTGRAERPHPALGESVTRSPTGDYSSAPEGRRGPTLDRGSASETVPSPFRAPCVWHIATGAAVSEHVHPPLGRPG